MSINPVKGAIEVFLEIKKKLDELKRDDVESKLRARAREIPGMITDIGLIPTLSFCLAKAGVHNLALVFRWMSDDSKRSYNQNVSTIKPEELSYALFVYTTLKYLGRIKGLQFNIEDLKRLSRKDKNEEFISKLYEYLNILTQDNKAIIASKLLQQYLIQFKRLCEASFKPER